MKRDGEVFVGIDAAKTRNAIAVAEGGRNGEIRYLDEIDNTADAIVRLARKLSERHETVHFCYEAGPTGYGLYRQLVALGYDRIVVAPSLIPRRPGEPVKTNRRDAQSLARLLRAGELTAAVRVPDETHEAVRDLVRARAMAIEDYRSKRQHISSFLLRHGRVYLGSTTWKGGHLRWLDGQILATQRSALPSRKCRMQCVGRSNASINWKRRWPKIVPSWTMAPVVKALQAMREVGFLTVSAFVAEAGDLRRFDHPRQLMAFLGLVPSERSTGDTRRQGRITKTGNSSARKALVEAAWTRRHSAGIEDKH